MCQVLEFVERSKQSKSGKCWQMKPDVGKQNVCTIRRLHRESICSKQSVSRRAQPIFFLGSSGRTWPFFAASLISLIIFFSWFWRLVLSRSSSRIDLADALLLLAKPLNDSEKKQIVESSAHLKQYHSWYCGCFARKATGHRIWIDCRVRIRKTCRLCAGTIGQHLTLSG